MRAAEGAGEHPAGVAAIRLLLLTGFRRLEGLGLRRDWLNADESAVCFPDTKSGAQKSPAHLTPPSFRLSADPDALKTVIDRPALELLLAQPRSEKSPFFFPAARAQTRSSTRTMPMKCPSPQSIAELPPERRERVDARYRELRQEVEGLRELREIAGKAQLDVAAALHITQPSVSKLEKQIVSRGVV